MSYTVRFNHNQFWIFPDFIQAVWDYGANESIWYLIFLQTLENQVCHLICRYMYLMLFVGLIEMKNHWASSKLATHKERRYKKWYKIKLAIKIRSWKKNFLFGQIIMLIFWVFQSYFLQVTINRIYIHFRSNSNCGTKYERGYSIKVVRFSYFEIQSQ